MDGDQTIKIANALRRAMKGGPDTCATLEVSGEPELWVQFVGSTVNAAYPHAEPPNQNRAIGSLLPELAPKSIDWNAGLSATFEFAEFDTDDLAKWIDRYFVLILGCKANSYDLKIGEMEL